MKSNISLLNGLLLVCCLGSAFAQVEPVGNSVKASRFADPIDQPYINAWWPETILDWTPEGDPDSPYNRSSVALRDRFLNPETQVNDHARPNEATINPLSAFHPTSFNPSQGSLDFNYYTFSYWQYVDRLVFWGGSASEGIILAPNPTVTDAAHRNGAKVLGNVFFPPTVFGGEIDWVWEFVQKEGETFPVADKMIEIAEYYGFDGWFLNQETAGGNTQLAEDMRDFMIYMQENSDLEIEWYDAMTESGSVSWQNQLNTANDWYFQYNENLVSETIFLNFWWGSSQISNSRAHANSLGRSEFDVYAGIDVQSAGYNTNVTWSAVFPEGQSHVTSMGIHRPDWTFASAFDNDDFYERANRFWVGENRDPSNTSGSSSWKGFAHYVPAFSPITSLPFVTNFNTGHGQSFYVDGELASHSSLSETGWNNLSLQDVLPTWRWIVEGDGVVAYPEFDWNNAYYGGSSVKISGSNSDINLVRLYKTELEITSHTALDIAFKQNSSDAVSAAVALVYAANPGEYVIYEIGDVQSDEWQTQRFDLSSVAGQTLSEIAIQVWDGSADYELNIGRIAVFDTLAPAPTAASNLTVENRVDDGDIITLRLRWDHSSDPTRQYDIVRVNPDQSMTHLGSTPNNAYFVPSLHRESGDSIIEVQVVAVGEDFGRSEPTSVEILAYVPPAPATNPSPADGEIGVVRNATLSWTPGLGAESHDVYFGTENPPSFVGNQAETSYQPPDMEAKTEYYWRIDEVNPVGTTEGHLWVFSTGTEFADTSGGALLFDGDDDYVDMGNDESLQLSGNQITMEAKVFVNAFKPQVWAGSIIVKDYSGGAGQDHGYMLRTGNNGEMNINIGDGSWHELTSPGGSVPLQEWTHVAGTYDGQNSRLFVNGIEVAASGTMNFSIGNAQRNLLIGESPGFPGRVFDGKIDEVRLWNVARTPAQLQQTMDGLLDENYYATADSGLVGYWRFDDGSGQLAEDLSVNGNHGTLGSTTGEDANDPEWTESDVVNTTGEPEDQLPQEFVLEQNYPNPFNPSTTIRYQLPLGGHVDLNIYDVSGRLVRRLVSGSTNAGVHDVVWDGTNDRGQQVASGVYFYRLMHIPPVSPLRRGAGGDVITRKMLLIR